MAIEAISKFRDFNRIIDAKSNITNLTTKINTLETNVKSSLAKQWVKSSDSYGGGSVLSNLSQLTNGPKFQSVSYLPSNPVETLPWFYIVSNVTNLESMTETGYIVTRNSAELFNRAYGSGGKCLMPFSNYRATIKFLPGFYLVDYQLYIRGAYYSSGYVRTASSINYYSGDFWVVHPTTGNLERNWIADSIYLWDADTGKSNHEKSQGITNGYGMIKVGTADSTTPISCTFLIKIFGTSGYNFMPCLGVGAKFTKVANISS